MLVATFPVGPLQCNCSILACKETGEAAVIDPGGDADEIVRIAEENGLKIKYLLHTHAHFDHILGAKGVKERTGAQICLHQGDQWLYDNIALQGSFLGMPMTKDDLLPVDTFLEDEQELKIGNLTTKVLHTPGHTPGSLCFSCEDQSGILFAGDTLFHGSIGRTDLWGGSFEEIIKSIKGRLLTLDDSTTVIAGHGPDTTIWNEKRANAFLV